MDIVSNNQMSLVAVGGKSLAGRTGQVDATNQASAVAQNNQPSDVAGNIDGQLVAQAASSIQGFVQNIQRDLNFELDDASGRVVVKVIDSNSGDVIRQIPSEDALRLAENIDAARSLLFKAEA
ncbi:flagellar biosynthesis protein FlaG [Pseudomonas sp. J237]|jgi:flagellar protein FlaG|nr:MULTISPECIES: flagellar protein FlaG [Pseudomonas]OEO24123.1 flagellar biosynthesis protein FlaG [Pseudomonas sp. J237]